MNSKITVTLYFVGDTQKDALNGFAFNEYDDAEDFNRSNYDDQATIFSVDVDISAEQLKA